MPEISESEIKSAFGDDSLVFVADPGELREKIRGLQTGSDVFLMMSSGTFGGMKLPEQLLSVN